MNVIRRARGGLPSVRGTSCIPTLTRTRLSFGRLTARGIPTGTLRYEAPSSCWGPNVDQILVLYRRALVEAAMLPPEDRRAHVWRVMEAAGSDPVQAVQARYWTRRVGPSDYPPAVVAGWIGALAGRQSW